MALPLTLARALVLTLALALTQALALALALILALALTPAPTLTRSKPLKNIKFAFEVNEMAWDHSGKQFFLTTGGGTVEVFGYEQMLKPGPAESARTLHAHTANCYCIEFAPNGKPKPKPNPNPNPYPKP